MRARRFVRIGTGVAALALLLSACGGGSAGSAGGSASGPAPAPAPSEAAPSVALVVNQSAGDLGPIDDMLRGLERVAQELGATTTFVEALDPATYEAAMRNVADAGADVVVVTFPPMGDALANVAPDYPNVRWVHIFGFDGSLPNVVAIGFATHEAAYLAGLIGGAVSSGDTVGYVGGAAFPQSNANHNAFVRGAAAVREGISGIPTFSNSYEDPAKGLELGSSLYASGVDVIFMDASATNEGIIEAARARGTYAVDFTTQRFEQDADVIAGGVEILWGATLFYFVELALGDGFVSGVASSSLANGGLEVAINERFLAGASPAVAAALEAVRPRLVEALAAIIDGSLVIEFEGDL